MSREIKFRAWDKDELFMAHECQTMYDGGCKDEKTENKYGYMSCFTGFFEDEFELMQYTGLHDKNGKEIYEGDILQGHGNKDDLAKVVFGEFYIIDVATLEKIDRAIGWHYEVIPTDAISMCEPFNISMPLTDFYINRGEFEVIGNIYENPELLERMKENGK